MIKKNERIIAIGINILSVLVLICMTCLAFNNSIWKDEVFDLQLIRNPYRFFLFENQDSAPPIHFILLKFWVDTVKIVFPNVSTIIIAKLSSIIPFYIILIFSNIKMKKRWGQLAAALFPFLSLMMPHLLGLTIEIRQYSWVYLFTVVWFIYFFDFLDAGSWKKAFLCTVLGVLATFTHYYACFAMVLAYIVVSLVSIIKKDSKMLKQVIFMMGGSVILFLPWLFVVNLSAEMDKFHILINEKNIIDVLLYVFMTDTNKMGIGYIVAGIFILLCIFLYIYNNRYGSKSIEHLYLNIGLSIPFFVLVVGVFIGIAIKPIFQSRYILPVMGCFWLAFSILVGKLKDKDKLCSVILLFLAAVSMLNGIKVIKDELSYSSEMKKTEQLIELISEEDIVFSNDYRMIYCLDYYSDGTFIDLSKENELTHEQIDSILAAKGTLYYIFLLEYGVEIQPDQIFKNDKISWENIGEYRLEYLSADVYQLKDK